MHSGHLDGTGQTGDGTAEETEAAGSAWRGTEESWTETATSHTYSTRDDVTASVTVVFTTVGRALHRRNVGHVGIAVRILRRTSGVRITLVLGQWLRVAFTRREMLAIPT